MLENDKWRSAGRTGMGAVLGSKKVKALVFNGDARREWPDPRGMDALVKDIRARAKDHPGVAAYKKWGTPMTVDLMNEAGAFPTRYWSRGKVEHLQCINAQGMQKELKVRPDSCLALFVGLRQKKHRHPRAPCRPDRGGGRSTRPSTPLAGCATSAPSAT